MEKKWQAFLKQPKQWRLLLLIIIALISIKPAIFTWNLIWSGNYFRTKPSHAEKHMYAAVFSRPAAFHAFKKYDWNTAARLLIKSIIVSRDLERLEKAELTATDRQRLKSRFQNNLYLQHLFPGFLPPANHPEHLDQLSLEFLADARLNRLNKEALENYLSRMSREFLLNLADYCKWEGNPQLAESLTAAAGFYREDKTYRPYRTYKTDKTYRSYLPPSTFPENWVFSNMANQQPFAEGSFTMDVLHWDGIDVIRLMGFYTRQMKGRADARGGIRLNSPLTIDRGYFRFTLYYATRTGNEGASFMLAQALPEYGLPSTREQWVRMDYYLDNSSAAFNTIRPIIRMKGTGAFWISGVQLVKLEKPPRSHLDSPLVFERFLVED